MELSFGPKFSNYKEGKRIMFQNVIVATVRFLGSSGFFILRDGSRTEDFSSQEGARRQLTVLRRGNRIDEFEFDRLMVEVQQHYSGVASEANILPICYAAVGRTLLLVAVRRR